MSSSKSPPQAATSKTPGPTPRRPPSYPILPELAPAHDPPALSTLSLSLPASKFVFSCAILLFNLQTRSIVLVHDTKSGRYMLPRGRKDRDESMAACALREGYEESGFRGELLDWGSDGTHQPKVPGVAPGDGDGDRDANREAFWVQALPMMTRRGVVMYFTYYFIGTIPDGAVADPDRSRLVGKHEQGYEGRVVKVEEAIRRIGRGRSGARDSMVFVADVDWWNGALAEKRLVEQGKVWVEGGEGGEDADPEWEDLDAEGEGQGEVAAGAEEGEGGVKGLKANMRIEKHTAIDISDSGVGGTLVPKPQSGADDGNVQARVVWEAWRRLLQVYGERIGQ